MAEVYIKPSNKPVQLEVGLADLKCEVRSKVEVFHSNLVEVEVEHHLRLADHMRLVNAIHHGVAKHPLLETFHRNTINVVPKVLV